LVDALDVDWRRLVEGIVHVKLGEGLLAALPLVAGTGLFGWAVLSEGRGKI
jgi:hypothetical protein